MDNHLFSRVKVAKNICGFATVTDVSEEVIFIEFSMNIAIWTQFLQFIWKIPWNLTLRNRQSWLQREKYPLQPWVMVAKDIFPFATVTDGCEETKIHGIFRKFWRNCVQNAIFMGKFYEFHLFATVRHGCKGKNILCNLDSWK